MTINHISLGQRIRLMRKRKGLTQLHLSELVGLSPTYISYIESGNKCMSLATFVEIANALNVTADELLIHISNSSALRKFLFLLLLSSPAAGAFSRLLLFSRQRLQRSSHSIVCFHLDCSYFTVFDEGIRDNLQSKNRIRILLFQSWALICCCPQQFANSGNSAQRKNFSLAEEFFVCHLYGIAGHHTRSISLLAH